MRKSLPSSQCKNNQTRCCNRPSVIVSCVNALICSFICSNHIINAERSLRGLPLSTLCLRRRKNSLAMFPIAMHVLMPRTSKAELPAITNSEQLNAQTTGWRCLGPRQDQHRRISQACNSLVFPCILCHHHSVLIHHLSHLLHHPSFCCRGILLINSDTFP